MRKYPIVLTMSAIFLCADAQSHPISLRPSCDEDSTFIPVHIEVISPSALHQAYLDFMSEQGFSSCYFDKNGNPDPESCGGVDASIFATHFAQQLCRQLSDGTDIFLEYSVGITPELATPDESHHKKYSFAHTLQISCGTCVSDVYPR